jgi:DNA-binding NarL/FixJ family response regulator
MPLRCLLVDDSDEFLTSARRLLESQGLLVVGSASSGAEAIRLAAAIRPDVVLVDVDLGGESGFELTRALAARPSPPAIVLISTHPEEDLRDAVAASPAVGFLAKRRLSAAAIAELVAAR